MTVLPDHRRMSFGRTWDRSWSPSDMDPIRHYRAQWSVKVAVLVVLLFAIFGALVLARWLAA